MMSEKLSDIEGKYIGCLVGLAACDALGTTLEFKRPGTFEPVSDIVGGGPFGLEAGQWTDDTSMALCLAESLIECNDFNAKDQMDRYLNWYKHGHLSSTGTCFDIGNTTRTALEKYKRTGEPFAGSHDPYSAGNGSIMRLAPVPLFYAHRPNDAMRFCTGSSLTTHAAQECLDACRYFGSLIIGAVNGFSKEQLLAPLYHPLPGYWDQNPLSPKINEIAYGSFKAKKPPAIKGDGYVVNSLEAALWAFHNSETFRDGALLAVNLGDDADTTGAVYGQLAGAYYGVDRIPATWRLIVTKGPVIESMARLLHQHSLSAN